MTIYIYDYNIREIIPIKDAKEKGYERLRFTMDDHSEVSIYLTHEQALTVKHAIDQLFPPAAVPIHVDYTTAPEAKEVLS